MSGSPNGCVEFEERKARAVEEGERVLVRAEERLKAALETYGGEVAVHEVRGDGFFSTMYLTARREAVLAQKFHEAKRSALVTARAEMAAVRLGEL